MSVQLNDLVDIEQITVICLGQFHSDLKEEMEFGDKDDKPEVFVVCDMIVRMGARVFAVAAIAVDMNRRGDDLVDRVPVGAARQRGVLGALEL